MSEDPWSIGKLTRKREDGSTYWSYCIKWVDQGGSHRVSLGTNDRSAAQAKAGEFWSRRTLARADTVGEIVEAYIAAQKGKNGEKRKKEAWVAAKPFWATMRVHHIVPDADGQEGSGAEYIKQRQRAANTIRKELGLVSTALSWARDKKLITVVPKIRLPAIPESSVDHLSKVQFRKFLAGCKAPHVRLFAQLAVTTGARSAALLELPWVRVDLEKRRINLRSTDKITPGNKGRGLIPVNDRLLPLLIDAKEAAQTPFVIESGGNRILSIKKGIAAAAERSGIHCTPHMFRHSAAVWMAEARVPMSEIAAYLGHKNTRVTESTYARYHPDYLQEAAKALDW